MATPRSHDGFKTAISVLEEVLGELDQQLQAAEADSSQEEDLLAEKAEKSIELEQLKQKYEEFTLKEQAKTKEKQADESEDQSEDQSEDTKPEPEEEKWPETMYVAARNDIGFMVNPYTHFKHGTGFQKVAVDNWTIAQVKAGFLIVDKG